MTDICYEIERLLNYALKKELIEKEDIIYSRNSIMGVLKLQEYFYKEITTEELETPSEILNNILDWAEEQKLIEENSITSRDLLDTAIMDCLLPRPSEVIKKFEERYSIFPKLATDYYYKFSKDSNYIRMDRINKNLEWTCETPYGDLELTINLSKPEKDPKAIAAAKNIKSSSYPKCLLCRENEGYFGTLNHPARQNLRLIPLTLSHEEWFIQYSPYVYYNEHSIIFSSKHVPMKISRSSIEKLLEFTEQYPHYFVGSNADLPIVGGSILSHDHFQGGRHDFPMAKAHIEKYFDFYGFPSVSGGIVKWPMSVIRINSENKFELLDLAEKILNKWRGYSDVENEILSTSNNEPHNTITPIVRRRGKNFELDLVLRNNRVSEEHPLGIFHPHTEVHNIKKENIGLIEVMGLAILPGRLKDELQLLGEYLLDPDYIRLIKEDVNVNKHLNLAIEVKEKYKDLNKENIDVILKEVVGKIFFKVLSHSGVYKDNDKGKKGFERFLNFIND